MLISRIFVNTYNRGFWDLAKELIATMTFNFTLDEVPNQFKIGWRIFEMKSEYTKLVPDP